MNALEKKQPFKNFLSNILCVLEAHLDSDSKEAYVQLLRKVTTVAADIYCTAQERFTN